MPKYLVSRNYLQPSLWPLKLNEEECFFCLEGYSMTYLRSTLDTFGNFQAVITFFIFWFLKIR